MAHAAKSRLAILIIALAALAIASAAACGGDSEPEPTPTAAQPPPTVTPIPTPTPKPTPTATAIPIPSTAKHTGSMRGFVIGASTTGKDLVDRLSTAETDCIRAAFDEAIYQIILATPLLQGGSAEDNAVLFGCLEPDNVVLFGVAFDDVLAGGRSQDTRTCLVDLSLEHPDLVYNQLRLEWKGEQVSPTSERHTYILQYWNCLTDAESAELIYRVNAVTDRASPLTGSDLVALLPESEAACIREVLSKEQIDALLDATPLEAVRIGAPAAACLSPESIASGFLAAAEIVVGGLTEGSANCIREYVLEHPTFLPLFSADPTDALEMSPSATRTIAEGNRAIFGCYTDDELVRAQDLALAAMAQRE